MSTKKRFIIFIYTFFNLLLNKFIKMIKKSKLQKMAIDSFPKKDLEAYQSRMIMARFY
jgi:hypothetical protein